MRHVSLAERRNLAFLRILEKDNRKSDANLHNFPLVHYHDQIGIPCWRIKHYYFIYYHFFIILHIYLIVESRWAITSVVRFSIALSSAL